MELVLVGGLELELVLIGGLDLELVLVGGLDLELVFGVVDVGSIVSKSKVVLSIVMVSP